MISWAPSLTVGAIFRFFLPITARDHTPKAIPAVSVTRSKRFAAKKGPDAKISSIQAIWTETIMEDLILSGVIDSLAQMAIVDLNQTILICVKVPEILKWTIRIQNHSVRIFIHSSVKIFNLNIFFARS